MAYTALPLVEKNKQGAIELAEYYMSYGYKTFTGKIKITSYGVMLLENISDFMNNDLSCSELYKASDILYPELQELKKYEARDPALAQSSDFRGEIYAFWGLGTFDGKINEKKPSAYTSFKITKKDKDSYLDKLSETLIKSYGHIKSGFKAHEDDQAFGMLVRSLDEGEANLTQTIAINDYLVGIYKSAYLALDIEEKMKRAEMFEIHKPEFINMSRSGKAYFLEQRGYRMASRPVEFLVEKLGGPGISHDKRSLNSFEKAISRKRK
jgi:hypothetical protein